MLKTIVGSFLLVCTALLYSCTGTVTRAETETEKPEIAATTETGHSAALRAACEKLIKAEAEKDTVTSASLLDANFSITARGQTFASRDAFRAYMKTLKTEAATPVQSTNTYTIEKVEAGSVEPVWAGYESGTFVSNSTSDDGSYNRKLSGPYYRAWKLVDGQWKCYHIVLMGFSCEGNDCSE